MKRIDNRKASLVEILGAIKFARPQHRSNSDCCAKSFAGFNQRARAGYPFSLEDSQLVRSAN